MPTFIAVSIAAALVGFGGPWAFTREGYSTALGVSLCMALIWFLVLVFAVVRYGKRGMCILLGLPLALYWPTALGLLFYGCLQHSNACL